MTCLFQHRLLGYQKGGTERQGPSFYFDILAIRIDILAIRIDILAIRIDILAIRIDILAIRIVIVRNYVTKKITQDRGTKAYTHPHIVDSLPLFAGTPRTPVTDFDFAC